MGKTPQNILDNNQRWREKNREKIRETSRVSYAANAEKRRQEARDRKAADPAKKAAADKAYYLNHKKRFRRDILVQLGGKCVRCGFGDWRGLQIDHVGNGGTKHRKSFKNIWTYYKSILQNIDTGEYQVLCANCNQIKRYEEGPC